MNVHHLLRKPEEAHFVDEAAATTARVVDRVLVDLFWRHPKTSGWVKAIWVFL